MRDGTAGVVAEKASLAQEGEIDSVGANAVSAESCREARCLIKYRGTPRGICWDSDRHEQHPCGGVIACGGGSRSANVDSGLHDHCNTAQTQRLGLPGVKRLMDDVEIDPQPGKGTRVTVPWMRNRSRPRCASVPWTAGLRMCHGTTAKLKSNQDRHGRLAAAGRIRAHRTERISGDLATTRSVGECLLVALVDAPEQGSTAAAIRALAEWAEQKRVQSHVSALKRLDHECAETKPWSNCCDRNGGPCSMEARSCCGGQHPRNVRRRSRSAVGMVCGRGTSSASESQAGTENARRSRTPPLFRGVADDFKPVDYPTTLSDSSEIASQMVAWALRQGSHEGLRAVTRCMP